MANRLGMESQAAGSFPTQHNSREKKLAETIREDKNLSDTFSQALLAGSTDNTDGTPYTGATGEVLAMHSGKAMYEVAQLAVASAAVVAPFQSADGLELKPVAAADALELSNGNSALCKQSFVIGTDEDFFCEATIKIDDISDVTEMVYGFRKVQAYQADYNDYTDLASFDIGTGADGRINLSTALNNAAVVTTNTTNSAWLDTESHTLRLEVNKLGQVSYKYDGSAPTVIASFTFDSGDRVIPFLALDTEVGDPGVSISSWKVGKK